MNTSGLIMGAVVDEIRPLGIVEGVELEDVITISEAQEIASAAGCELSASYIARSAKKGRIANSRKSGGTWLMSKTSFLEWLNNRPSPGRPVDKAE